MNQKVSNRELVRNYSKIRIKLLSGEFEEVLVPQKEGAYIKLCVIREETPFERLVEKIKKRPVKYVKRPGEDLF